MTMSINSFAITENEAKQCIERYYSYLQEYAEDVSRSVDLTKRIQSLFIDGKGSVYNDIFTKMDKNPDTDGDVLSYLSSIDKYRKTHLGFYVENVVVIINADNTAYLEYDKTVTSGGKRIYTIDEEAIIKNGKIVCIYKKGTGKRNQYANIDIKINSVQIAGADGDGNVLTSYGVTLEKNKISRIRIKVDYEVSNNTNLIFKMIAPMADYTLTKEIESNYTSKYVNWGWDIPGNFKEGNYKIELWNASNTKLLYTQSFTVKDTQTTTYLTVSKSELYFDAGGGTKTITVTSNKDWEISVDTYSWGHLTRNGSTLTLKVDENTESTERTDYFKLSAGDKEVKINITQEGQKITGEIKDITVEHNVFKDGVKGMKILVDFSVQNMKGIDGSCAVYFYYENGNRVMDKNQKYKTADGHAATHTTIRPGYHPKTVYTDLEIFMPYNELEVGIGKHSLKFYCVIWEHSTSSAVSVAESQYYFFTLTNN